MANAEQDTPLHSKDLFLPSEQEWEVEWDNHPHTSHPPCVYHDASNDTPFPQSDPDIVHAAVLGPTRCNKNLYLSNHTEDHLHTKYIGYSRYRQLLYKYSLPHCPSTF
jgi:hypothetical protein